MLDDANPTKLPKRSQGCPLTLSDLTKKDCTWNWGIEQQNAFEALKKAFTMAPVLRIPNDENPFKLSTDASDFATGAVLL